MDGKVVNHCMDEKNTETYESKSTVTSRLDRLETELNLLLMLSTNNTITKESNKTHHEPEPNDVKEASMSKINCSTISETSHNNKNEADKVEIVDKELNTVNYAVIKLQTENPPVLTKKAKKFKVMKTGDKCEETENFKKLKKKKSVCMCKKKRSKHSINNDPKSCEDKKTKSKNQGTRSKSVDSQILTIAKASGSFDKEEPDENIKKALSKSCLSSQNIEDLCSLVVDMKKNQDLGTSISDQWKSKCLNINKECNNLRTLQLQTDAQKKFLNICYQTELKHRKLLENFINVTKATCEKCTSGKVQLEEIQQSLEEHKSQNEELLYVCNELRHELVLSEERLWRIQHSSELSAKLEKEMLDKVESNSELLKSQAAQRDAMFKNQIKEHLSEIEELRLSCAKNAQWACEESSIKTSLLKENNYLHKKLNLNQEKQQKYMDHIKILRKALLKVSKNDPNVKKLVDALHKYEWNSEVKQFDNSTSASVHEVEVCNSQAQANSSPDEAKRLIQELNEVIRQQNSRIQELVDLTSSFATTSTILDRDSAPSREQALELSQAKEELEDVKERYYQLVCTVKDMKKQMKHMKHTQKAAESAATKDCLKNEVSASLTLLSKNKQSISSNVETINKLTQIIDFKSNEISQLRSDLQQVKDKNNNLMLRMKKLKKMKETLKEQNDKMRIDVIQQDSIIGTLEKQFEIHQHEIILQKIAINKEKEQAMRAAQFATNKLMETMVDYQERSKSQTLIRNVVTRMLQEKDNQFRDTIDRVCTLTFDPRYLVEAKKRLCNTSEHGMNDDDSSTTIELNHHYRESDEVMHALNDAQISTKSLQALQASIAKIICNSHSTEIFQPCPNEWCSDYEESPGGPSEELVEEVSDYITPQLFTLHTLPEEDEDQLDEKTKK